MRAKFDNAASNYDNSFTNSIIGKAQREFVYQHLSKFLKNNSIKSILEINCGTGEDAIWLAKQNFQIIATDISEEMILIANRKEKPENLTFKKLNINAISEFRSDKSFDLLFSNFGGLNCLSKQELKLFFENASNIVSENGYLVLVLMPKNTLWEQFYFLLKGDFQKIFRRKKQNIIANVDGEKVITFYHNPNEIVSLAANNFVVKKVNPIGFFVPPSYLESFFRTKPRLISFLIKLENRVKNISNLAKYSDHYLIVLQKI